MDLKIAILFSWLFLASVSGQGPDDNPNEGINPEALPAATLGAAAPAVDPGSPNYKYQNNPCKCQCTDPKDVYGKNGQFGNCQRYKDSLLSFSIMDLY